MFRGHDPAEQHDPVTSWRTEEETGPILQHFPRLQVQPMVATEPITSPTHLAAQGLALHTCLLNAPNSPVCSRRPYQSLQSARCQDNGILPAWAQRLRTKSLSVELDVWK